MNKDTKAVLTPVKSPLPSLADPSNYLVIAWKPLIIITSLIVLLLKLVIAFRTIGTNDVISFKMFADTIAQVGGVEAYHQIAILNHPPFVINLLRLWLFLTSITGVSFGFWVRAFSSLADVGIIWLGYKILSNKAVGNFSPGALWLMALSPVTFLVNGFHGNTDSLMIFFMLLSLYLLDMEAEALATLAPAWLAKALQRVKLSPLALAGMSFGVSLNIKIVPVILIPCIFFYLKDIRKNMEFFLMAGQIWLLLSLPHLLQDPIYIIKQVFGYNSIYGHWGLSRLNLSYAPSSTLGLFYHQYGKYALYLIIGITSWLLNHAPRRIPIFYQISAILFIFLALAPGFGVQYLVWLVPCVLALGVETTLIFSFTSGCFLFMVYNFWATKFPWDYADSNVIGDWRGYIIDYELIAWLAIFVIALVIYPWFIWRNWYKPVETTNRPKYFRQKLFGLVTALIIASMLTKSYYNLFIYNDLMHLNPNNALIEQLKATVANPNVDNYMNLSYRYFETGKYEEVIQLSQKILTLSPNNAIAYNNMCAAYNSLKQWDKAIEMGNKALTIDPKFTLAQNNLAWANSQKAAQVK